MGETKRGITVSLFDAERKELSKKIYACKCMPIFIGVKYCKDCQHEVLEFMNKYGVGVLAGDLVIEDLQKENQTLKNINSSLQKQLLEKIKQVEKLIEEMKNNDSGSRSA